MRLEATQRWTEARLVALAGALALPCPVPESVLFDPDHAFRQQCLESDTTLQRAIKRVFDHAGLRCDAAVVLWKTGLGTTVVESDGGSWFFEIDARWKQPTDGAEDPEQRALVIGGILARVVGRALLARRGIGGTAVGGADAELAAILAGLGALLLADRTGEGALHPRLVRYAYARTCASLGLGLHRTLDVLPSRVGVVALWPRVSRRPLAFTPVEPHVIIRCFCAKRLRVPTGALGTTTCPACKRKREFDGRACRIASISIPRPLPPADRPVYAAWQRPLVWFVEMPLAARLLVVVLAMLVAFAFV